MTELVNPTDAQASQVGGLLIDFQRDAGGEFAGHQQLLGRTFLQRLRNEGIEVVFPEPAFYAQKPYSDRAVWAVTWRNHGEVAAFTAAEESWNRTRAEALAKTLNLTPDLKDLT